jgi:phage tail protein X
MTSYTTHQNEMIDAICRQVYGDESGYVEAVLAANPGLAALATPLPIGTVVFLPEIAKAAEVVTVVSLWD